jgi:hypothetical protein
MSKAVMLSIRPKWVEKIASGEKTIEVRKTRPKLPTPFRPISIAHRATTHADCAAHGARLSGSLPATGFMSLRPSTMHRMT